LEGSLHWKETKKKSLRATRTGSIEEPASASRDEFVAAVSAEKSTAANAHGRRVGSFLSTVVEQTVDT
jgi:hypothetical protein